MRVSPSNSNSIQATDLTGSEKTEKAKKVVKTDDADKSSKASKAESRANAAASTKAELSSKGREMAAAKAAAGGAPDVREEKIAALKARIAAGKYEVDSNAVADRMVDDHLRAGIG